ncbi:MutS protein-like protein 4 [Golovinomyces cichoracearum]|uniref:MutS protein-like protein 4 n=1 Tax=Golovinomyces cichoracearum TaxID=62708 RepID=A0A420IQ07_9PEZI|nr:MutS protein-like protein 4 [Golovinomyces cichoracearum]
MNTPISSLTTSNTTIASLPHQRDESSDHFSQYRIKSSNETLHPDTQSSLHSSKSRSTISKAEQQKIVCAISEARGISPTVGLAFVSITNGEAVLSQICDNQFYVRSLNKLEAFGPTDILIVSTHGPPNPKSKMYSVIEENIPWARLITIDRKYWSETAGLDYIQKLAFHGDVEAINVAVAGNYFATCCFAAALKYIDLSLSLTFAFHSLRIKYQASEGSMMIDLSTVQSLELIQNVHDSKSKDCLFGLLNDTLTPMGTRLLRSSILQPSTQANVLTQRYEALEELISKEDVFLQTRQALKSVYDIERLLSSVSELIDQLIVIPTQPDIRYSEQLINHILMLKSFVELIPPIRDALGGARSDLLSTIRDYCCPENIERTLQFIKEVINDDVTYQKTPLDLRNQRTYAVKSGVSGLLDVARQTFKEATEDVHQHVLELNQSLEINAEIRYDNSRKYYLRILEDSFNGIPPPEVLINCYRIKGYMECQTLDLVKLNQRIEDSHQEVILMSDKTIQELVNNIREEIPILFRVCESIAMLDMITAFGQIATTNDYVRPEITECIAIKSGRHPIREKVHPEKFIANDVYASSQKRFQIITGCNMSGKSTYIRSIALMAVMAQIGSFIPASYASFPLIDQLFARVSKDDSNEANVSTFASEMRETAFILRLAKIQKPKVHEDKKMKLIFLIRNIDANSLAIFDELGRGTSSRDGLAIALSISEALIESRAMIWFATHFRELAQILSERAGVVNLHLSVDMSKENTMTMLYKIEEGYMKEEHYGLALARVVDLPLQVLEVAESVSKALDAQAAAKKKSSKAFAVVRRRKLVLGLVEALKQAESGSLAGKALMSWLQRLQNEFIHRMEEIETDVTIIDTQDTTTDEETVADTVTEDDL